MAKSHRRVAPNQANKDVNAPGDNLGIGPRGENPDAARLRPGHYDGPHAGAHQVGNPGARAKA